MGRGEREREKERERENGREGDALFRGISAQILNVRFRRNVAMKATVTIKGGESHQFY
jgi:hypothetical protein